MQLVSAKHTELKEPAIAVRALRKVYRGGIEAVKGVDFVVAPGEVFGLLGPNGAGKSTTIGMLTTTVVPTSGMRAAGRRSAESPSSLSRRDSPSTSTDHFSHTPFGPKVSNHRYGAHHD